MFRRIFASAVGAGIAVGLLIAALQHLTLVPLILEAEKYEQGSGDSHKHAQGSAGLPQLRIAKQGRGDFFPDVVAKSFADASQPRAGAEATSFWRPLLTTIATTLAAIGFAFVLTGAFAVSGRQVDAGEGLLWGLAGFAVFGLAPTFGLPPELPGAVAADLVPRQIWWICTVGATASALALFVFVSRTWAIPLGIALLLVLHVIGAPHPPQGVGLVPPELSAAFAAKSLVVNAVFWTLLGLAAGKLYARGPKPSLL